jgi:hypothetical protein
MIKNATVACAALLALGIVQPQLAQEKGGTIRVQLNYTGSGTVDANHKIFVALWDSADFAKPNVRVIPVDVKSTDSKDGVVTFTNVQKSPAYVSAAFDTTGKWDGQSGPPPAGASLGMYSSAPPTPEAINVAAGKSERVTIVFDDSYKMR